MAAGLSIEKRVLDEFKRVAAEQMQRLYPRADFSGAIVTETVFSWPGMGRFIVQAIYARDFPVVQAAVIFVAFVVVLINLTVDIIYAFLDPRIHYR